MGFFSRWFGRDGEAPARHANPRGADDGMRLDAQQAAAIVAEIDIDTAIDAHENWKVRLQNYLDGNSSEDLRPEVICLDDRCDLGKWLHGAGRQRLGHYPAFSVLVARHKRFHVQASTVVAHALANRHDRATEVLNSGYQHASRQVVLLLKELRRGLGLRRDVD